MEKEENYLNELADYARKQAEELIVVIRKYDDYSDEQIEELRTHFMAMFAEGTDWQKEQMMKKAVEGEVIVPIYEGNDVWSAEIKIPGRYKPDDKVRVIVLPKED